MVYYILCFFYYKMKNVCVTDNSNENIKVKIYAYLFDVKVYSIIYLKVCKEPSIFYIQN